MEVFHGISRERLEDILQKIRETRIALIGDLCLDVYWQADMTKSELSRETPHHPLPIVREWMSPGGAGNAAANIAALGPERVQALGVVGRDWRGDILMRKLREAGVATGGVVVSERAVTNAYCKPLRKGVSDVVYEDPRLDFNNYEDLPREDEARLLEWLDKCASEVDALCVSDQLLYGCITPAVRERIISLAKDGLKVIVDSRDRINLYTGVTLKPNEVEGSRATGIHPAGLSLAQYADATRRLAAQNKSNVCMTLGAMGCVYVDSQAVIHIPTDAVPPPIDICGAGDTFLAAFACALAAGVAPREAAAFANLAANVTVQKIGTTGSASPQEIRARHEQIQQLRDESNTKGVNA